MFFAVRAVRPVRALAHFVFSLHLYFSGKEKERKKKGTKKKSVLGGVDAPDGADSPRLGSNDFVNSSVDELRFTDSKGKEG